MDTSGYQPSRHSVYGYGLGSPISAFDVRLLNMNLLPVPRSTLGSAPTFVSFIRVNYGLVNRKAPSQYRVAATRRVSEPCRPLVGGQDL